MRDLESHLSDLSGISSNLAGSDITADKPSFLHLFINILAKVCPINAI